MVCTLPSTRSLSKASREGDWRENMANADISASGKAISVSSVRASGMLAKPFRTKRKSASAERCLRPLGATIDIAPPHVKAINKVSVRGILSHGGLRKDNPDIKVMTGFYRSPGIAALHLMADRVNAGCVKPLQQEQAQPIAHWRQRHGRRPLRTLMGFPDRAPPSYEGQPWGRIRVEKRHH